MSRGRHPVRLRQVAFVGFHRVGHVQAQVLELRAQGFPGDAEQKGGPGLVPARVLQPRLKACTTVPDPAPRFVKWGPGGAQQSHQEHSLV